MERKASPLTREANEPLMVTAEECVSLGDLLEQCLLRSLETLIWLSAGTCPILVASAEYQLYNLAVHNRRDDM